MTVKAKDVPKTNEQIETYLRLGWALTPAKGKEAINVGWGNDRLTQGEAETHVANGGTLGIVMGPASGVIDVEGDDEDAETTIEKLFQGETPPTPSFQSSRGIHRLFKYDPVLEGIDKAKAKSDRRGKVTVNGIEFRLGVNGKQIMSLAPPSTTDGFTRHWLSGLSPDDVEPAPLPQAIIDRLLSGRKHERNGRATATDFGKLLKGVSEGERERAAKKIIGKGLAGIDAGNEITATLIRVGVYAWNTQNRPPWERKSLDRLFNSLLASEREKRKTPDLYLTIEPWPKPVSGAALLRDLESYFLSRLVLPEGAPLILALWTLAAWGIDLWARFPHIILTSPQRRAGKTRTLEVMRFVVPKGLLTSSISAPALYRLVEKDAPTLLADECQSLSKGKTENAQALKELLQAGIEKDSVAVRCVGEDHTPKAFHVYGPKVLAMVGPPDETLVDRCIEIQMHRKRPNEKIKRWRSVEVRKAGTTLARKAMCWVEDNREMLAHLYDRIPVLQLENDRLAELLQPLRTVLTAADKRRLPTLEQSARRLDKVDIDDQPVELRLIAAVREVLEGDEWKGITFVSTQSLADELKKLPEAGWNLTARSLGCRLRRFNLRSEHKKDKTCRGFKTKALLDIAERYTPKNQTSETSETSKRPKRPDRKPRKNKGL